MDNETLREELTAFYTCFITGEKHRELFIGVCLIARREIESLQAAGQTSRLQESARLFLRGILAWPFVRLQLRLQDLTGTQWDPRGLQALTRLFTWIITLETAHQRRQAWLSANSPD